MVRLLSFYLGSILFLALGSVHALARGGADFNNDGFEDLAIPVPGDRVNGLGQAGSVIVLYGSSSGLGAVPAVFNQDTAGMPGTAAGNDHFGSALAWGDLNGDGYDDLAIGAPDDDEAGVNTGSVTILRGSAGGLTASGAVLLDAGDLYPGGAVAGDRFGAAVAIGDFDGDNVDDLAAAGPEMVSGGVVVYGFGGSGPPTNDPQYSFSRQGGARHGQALACGDFDGDGDDEVAVGMPGLDDSSTDQGAVSVYTVTRNGILTVRLIQEANGPNMDRDEFLGSALAVGDFNGNGKDDLAIGVPGQDVGGQNAAGEVMVVPGSAAGLDTTKTKFWNQNSAPGGVAIKD